MSDQQIDPKSHQFYRDAVTTMLEAGIQFLVGGAYAFERYTGIARHTKDYDVFLTRQETDRAMDVLSKAGYRTELTFPHWLGKAYNGEDFIDLIFGAGNGIAVVDDLWFQHAVDGESLGIPVKLCPAEEIIWSKAFIMERERFDGADIAHLLRARAKELDWERLLKRFEPFPRVLLIHLILFGFIYPESRGEIPAEVMTSLTESLEKEPNGHHKVCNGTLLSRGQYLIDIGRWGYRDARLEPPGTMSPEDIAYWTSQIEA